MALLKFLTAKQTGICADCGRVLRERHRKPCPECGCMNRVFTRDVIERLSPKDRVN